MICGRKRKVRKERTIENKIEAVMVEPTDWEASSFFPSPNRKLILAAHPFPSNPATAPYKSTNGKITLVAPFPNNPTPWPINIWSTIL